jgi:hypothetical protein
MMDAAKVHADRERRMQQERQRLQEGQRVEADRRARMQGEADRKMAALVSPLCRPLRVATRKNQQQGRLCLKLQCGWMQWWYRAKYRVVQRVNSGERDALPGSTACRVEQTALLHCEVEKNGGLLLQMIPVHARCSHETPHCLQQEQRRGAADEAARQREAERCRKVAPQSSSCLRSILCGGCMEAGVAG